MPVATVEIPLNRAYGPAVHSVWRVGPNPDFPKGFVSVGGWSASRKDFRGHVELVIFGVLGEENIFVDELKALRQLSPEEFWDLVANGTLFYIG